jgi:drug/metabolite transporter (DMT)-like permease
MISLLVMGVVQFGTAYLVFSKGLEKTPIQEASLILLIEPVLSPIWVNIVTGEVPSLGTFMGGGIILFSLAARYTFMLGAEVGLARRSAL